MGFDVVEFKYDAPLKQGEELRRIEGLGKVTSVAMGQSHAVAATADGMVWMWGSNLAGQFGNMSLKESSAPILVHEFR
ncbi:RCC1 domain-containing protein [Cohnella herbarum]|nr:RCC1 domain-containing protein [Cohnella herbarum]